MPKTLGVSPGSRSVLGAVLVPQGCGDVLQLYGYLQGAKVPQKCGAPLTITGTPKLWGWGCPRGTGCSEGAQRCRLPPKAIGLFRGVGVPRVTRVPRVSQVCGAGVGSRLRLAARLGWAGLGSVQHSQGGGDTGINSGDTPAAPPNGSKPAPQCPQNPSMNPYSINGETEARSPALPLPTGLPTKGPQGTVGHPLSEGTVAPGGVSKGSPASTGGRRTRWGPPVGDHQSASLQGGQCTPGYAPVSPTAGCPGTPWGGRVMGGCGLPPTLGKASWGRRGRISSGCHFPFTPAEGFATSLPPPGSINRAAEGRSAAKHPGGHR